RVMHEMMVLASQRPQVSHLPEQPLDTVQAGPGVARNEATDLVGEIQKYCARLEHRDRFAAIGGRGIDDRRDPVIGRDLEEFGLELIALADVHWMDRVRHPRFLEEHRHLVPVGGGPVVEIDHRGALGGSKNQNVPGYAPPSISTFWPTI